MRKRGRKWEASYWHAGHRHIAPAPFGTKSEALSFLAAVQTEIGRNNWIDPNSSRTPFEVVAAHWFVSNPAKRESTLAREEVSLRVHILPVLGSLRLDQVSPFEIQQVVNEWSRHRAPRSVRRDYDVIRAVFAYAVANDWLARTPCRNIRLPSTERAKRFDLTTEQVGRIVEALPERYGPMVWVGAVLGLRWSEVIGLKVSSIGAVSGTLTVTEAITRGMGGELVTGPPKSSAGSRTLTMPPSMVALLVEHIAQFCERRDPECLIFTNTEGRPIRYDNWRRREWLPAVHAAGCEGAGFHDLRRMAATSLVVAGVDIKTAQVRLGHSDPRMTLAVYASAPVEADREAAERLEQRYFPGDGSESVRAKYAPKRPNSGL